MSEQPQSWHHGLMAEWWAEFNLEAKEEIPYFQAVIADGGQPALDLACGAGRVLMPLLEAGLDVDGCDISPDMVARCRERVEQAGYKPDLYQQAMHELDLPRSYRTIYICDSFGIGGHHRHDAEALHRCYQHLSPGGVLVFNLYLPYYNAREWSYWLPEKRRELPESWSELGTGRRDRHSNGDDYEIATRLVDLNPLERRLTREMRAARWHEGQLVAQEEHVLQENLYFLHDVPPMLDEAGFQDVAIQGGYTGRDATPNQTIVTFVARKRG
jgi:SAM-dependent methyltransferase